MLKCTYTYIFLIKGVGKDLSHIETLSSVTAHVGPEQLSACLEDCDLVIVPAGLPRKPGM